MKIIPKRDFSHAGSSRITVTAGKKYNAVHATNQPNWQERGLVFVARYHSGPEILLTKEDYDVVLPIDRRDAPRGCEARLRRNPPHDNGPCCGCAYRRTKCYDLPEFINSQHSCCGWKRKDGREVVFVKRKRTK